MSDLDNLRLAVRHLLAWALCPTEEEEQALGSGSVWKKPEQMTETPKSLSDEQQRVLAALGGEPRSTAEIASAAALTIPQARKVLTGLLTGRPGASAAGRGKWVLAPTFEDTVAVLEEKLGHPVPDAVREALEQPDDATEPEPDDPVLSFEERLESALAEAQATA